MSEEDVTESNDTDLKKRTDLDTNEVHTKSLNIIGRCFETVEKASEDTVSIKTEDGLLVHYYIERLANNTIALEMVGEEGTPSGNLIENISTEDFNKRFKTCSLHKCPLEIKTVEDISKRMSENRVLMGEQLMDEDKFEEAEEKFNRALTFNEENVRATLGIGKSMMEQNRVEEAMEVFKKISSDNEIYEKKNKHTFNDFGIYMRRKGAYNLAIDSYEKAITVEENDEVLYFNLARAYAEKGFNIEERGSSMSNLQKAIFKLQEAVSLNKDFKEAKDYIKVLTKRENMLLNSLLEHPEKVKSKTKMADDKNSKEETKDPKK